MLSALIPSEHSYPAFALGRTTGTPEVRLSWSSRTEESFPSGILTPTSDRDRTVSRRSKPSSRTLLTGEQPDPWDLIQPQDRMSRHRGAKLDCRCELSSPISLLSPEYLLSVERWQFHIQTTGSLVPTFVSACAAALAVKLAFALTLHRRLPSALSQPWGPFVIL